MPRNPSPMESRATFEKLLTKNHVIYALVQDGEQDNIVPLCLTTVYMLGGSSDQLTAIYDAYSSSLAPWRLSPARISSVEENQIHLGDIRFQRAFMDYFSTKHVQLKCNYRALVDSQLVSDSRPLMYGLFGGSGQALIALGDSVEAQNSILLVQSLVLSSMHFSPAIHEILADPRLEEASAAAAACPSDILGRVAHDGRFSAGRSGPGWHHVTDILSNRSVKDAIMEYLHQLDTQDPELLSNLSRISVLMLCAAHKKDRPAFDLHLSRALSWIHSLQTLLQECHSQQTDWLIRGVWLLIILVYITQLRPHLDESLLSSVQGMGSWEEILKSFCADADLLQERYRDPHYLQALRSLHFLGSTVGVSDSLYLKAAWKLEQEWRGWTGLGSPRETSLNIRL